MMTYGSSQCLQYMSNEFSFALDLKSDVLLELALTVNLNYTNSHGNMASALHCETKLSLKSPVQYKTLAHYTPFTFIVKSERSEFISQLILVSKKKKCSTNNVHQSPDNGLENEQVFYHIQFYSFQQKMYIVEIEKVQQRANKIIQVLQVCITKKDLPGQFRKQKSKQRSCGWGNKISKETNTLTLTYSQWLIRNSGGRQ